MKIKPWIEAMRLRTLPVSLAGIITATGFAALYSRTNYTVALICLLFAILAQIASNFANEYFDFRGGLDRRGRSGPRRGVTEGDITPPAMLTATILTLALACITGCSLLIFGPWWILPVGVLIAVGVMAYSTGPYPLSHHGLGEAAVIFFFGIIPVNLTFFLQTGFFSIFVLAGSVAVGLMGANVLIVNNYRDFSDDLASGKRTLAVIFGRGKMPALYNLNAMAASILAATASLIGGEWFLMLSAAYLALHTFLFIKLKKSEGASLNPILGKTAMLMALWSIAFFLLC